MACPRKSDILSHAPPYPGSPLNDTNSSEDREPDRRGFKVCFTLDFIMMIIQRSVLVLVEKKILDINSNISLPSFWLFS